VVTQRPDDGVWPPAHAQREPNCPQLPSPCNVSHGTSAHVLVSEDQTHMSEGHALRTRMYSHGTSWHLGRSSSFHRQPRAKHVVFTVVVPHVVRRQRDHVAFQRHRPVLAQVLSSPMAWHPRSPHVPAVHAHEAF
jgi:hypothetical protein